MDVRSLTSLQMTMLLVILSQIITVTHMLPVDSPYRRLDLDLLLDPVHQEMQSDDLESKRVVPKSVYHTQLRITTESPCNIGTQRAKEGGPCLRINSSQGSVLDEKYLSAVLKDINRQGGSNGRRKHNRNRNRSTTTTTEVPVVQSTLQQDQDGVEEDDTMLVDLITSTYTPPSSLDEVEQTYELPGALSVTFSPMQNSGVEESDRVTGFRPGFGVMDSENEDALVPKTSTVRSTRPQEAVKMTSTTTTAPTDTTTLPQEISTQQEVTATTLSTGTPEGQTEVPDVSQVIPQFINANRNFTNQRSPTSSTTAKPDSITLSSAVTDGLVTRITTGPKEKTVNLTKEMGENVTATDVRVINFPPTPSRTVSISNSFPLNSNATTQSTTERLSVKKGQSNEVDFEILEFSTGLPQFENESFTTTSIPEKRRNRPPLIMASIMESDLAKRTEPQSHSQVKSEILGGEDTRTNVAAGAPILPILADKNSTPTRFNYSESLMTETTTQLPISQSMGPDVQDFEILVESTTLPHPEDSSSDFPTSSLSSHESKIDQSIAITDSSPVITWVQEGRRVTAKLEDEASFTSPNNVFFPSLNEELLPSTTTIRNEGVGIVGRIRFEDEETTTFETPREFTMTRKRVLIPFAPQPAPHHVEEGRSHNVDQQQQFQGRDSMRPTTSQVPPTMASQQSGEEDIDKLHHKSRTRNRMRNPDLEDVPQSRVQFPDEFFRHQQHQSSLSRDLQKQHHQQVVSKPIIGSYPQFISLDYLRLGDNYRRFRVF